MGGREPGPENCTGDRCAGTEPGKKLEKYFKMLSAFKLYVQKS